MNPCLLEWTIEAELPVPHQKKPMGFDHELVELLWRNGEVVLHSQTHKKQPGYDSNESRQFNKHDQPTIRVAGSCGNQINLTHDDETVAWLNCAIDDSFDKEFCSPFLSDISTTPLEADKSIRQPGNNKILKFDPLEINHVLPQSHHSDFDPNPMPPPRFHNFGSTQQHHIGGYQKGVNFPPPIRSSNAQLGGKEARRNLMLQDINEGSVTVGTSHCGSNQVAIEADTSRFSSSANRGLSAAMFTDYTGKVSPQTDTMDRDTFEPANTSSSSGRSGSSYARTCNQSTETNSQSNKRKSRDGEEPECQSKDDELESSGGNKSAQKSGTARRSRAAEVHNLSERRRRDRINEKMKALQELLPHSTKTDKASMLDEAIEYLKSLQMQLQMMWMGSGMASMMFPGVQHYMSRMGMGMGPPTVPSIHNAMHLARLPLVDPAIPLTQAAPNPAIPLTQAAPNQAAMCQNSMLNQVNYQGHLQNPNFPDQYASYMGFHPLQGASQPINIFGLGSHTAQQSQQLPYPTHSNTPST